MTTFKQGDRVLDGGLEGWFVGYRDNVPSEGIIERADRGGWNRSILKEYIRDNAGYIPRNTDNYWLVTISSLRLADSIAKRKWDGVGALPHSWYVTWEKMEDCVDTNKIFPSNKKLYVKGGRISSNSGNWLGSHGHESEIAGLVEISMEQFRRHVMKSPSIEEERNPWGLQRGDLITYIGKRAYFVGKNARPEEHRYVIEFETQATPGWPKSDSVPTDYIPIASQSFWNIDSTETLIKIQAAKQDLIAKPLGDKWAICITEENRERVKKWFTEKTSCPGSFSPGFNYHFPPYNKYGECVYIHIKEGYKLIDTGEFDRRILGEVRIDKERLGSVKYSSIRPEASVSTTTGPSAGAMEFYTKWKARVDLYVGDGRLTYAPGETSLEVFSKAVEEMFYGKRTVEKMPREVIVTRPKNKGRRQLI